jgi:hypothetical protein
MSCNTLDLFGRPFEVRWSDNAGRIISNGKTCYRFISFGCHEKRDADTLATALPLNVERCLIQFARPHEILVPRGSKLDVQLADPNDTMPIIQEVACETANRTCLCPTSFEGAMCNAVEDGRLPLINTPGMPESVLRQDHKALIGQYKAKVMRSLQDDFGKMCVRSCRAAFANGTVLYLNGAIESPMPSEAVAFFQQAAQQRSIRQLVHHAGKSEDELAQATEQLKKTQKVANATLKEALSAWMRDSPPGMKAVTAAKVKEAVARYLISSPEDQSLRKIGKQFGVSATTVFRWFREFTRATGLPVIPWSGMQSSPAKAN